jgi:hypothetical protein
MKKLEVNQMENLQGGSSACFVAVFAYASAIKAFGDDQNEFTALGVGFALWGTYDVCAKSLSYQLI